MANSAKSGTTGLLGLTGEVVGDDVELFATNATIGDTDPTFLYGITDLLGDLTRLSGGGKRDLHPSWLWGRPDSNFKGVSFAPTPEPRTYALMILGFGVAGGVMRRRRRKAAFA